MNVKIETYRGIDIIFNTENERFSYSFDEGSCHEKQTYRACVTSIDTFFKDNANFKPFFICNEDNLNKKIEVIGRRKDEKWVINDPVRGKRVLGKWEVERHYIYNEFNDEILEQITQVENAANKMLEPFRNDIKSLKNQLKLIKLSES